MGNRNFKFDKKQARCHARFLIDKISLNQRHLYNHTIIEQLKNLVLIKNANVIAGYSPMSFEINLMLFYQWCLLEHKTLLMPYITDNKLQFYKINQKEDIAKYVPLKNNTFLPDKRLLHQSDIDVVLIFCWAFNTDNYRIGTGFGYYDRYLANKKNLTTIGVAYPFCQLNFFAQPYDVSLSLILR